MKGKEKIGRCLLVSRVGRENMPHAGSSPIVLLFAFVICKDEKPPQ